MIVNVEYLLVHCRNDQGCGVDVREFFGMGRNEKTQRNKDCLEQGLLMLINTIPMPTVDSQE